MDFTATLTAEEVAALSDPGKTLAVSLQHMREIRPIPFTGNPVDDKWLQFEESLRLKNTLDAYGELASKEPTWERLALLLNCEYQLYVLNKETPLRVNPFLSHWVEAIQRLEGRLQNPRLANAGHPTVRDKTLTHWGLDITLLKMIKTLLLPGSTMEVLKRETPEVLHGVFVDSQQETELDLGTYIRMLEEEGIYEPPSQTQPAKPDSTVKEGVLPSRSGTVPGINPSKGRGSLTPPMEKQPDWKQALLTRFFHDPSAAISASSRLPIELPYLEFLTELISSRTLQSHAIDPAHVICNYLQHALRLVERMGEHASSTDGVSSGSASASVDGFTGDAELDDVDRSRAAQVRAVKLLLLFIRNLIRKGMVSPQTLYFEIQEICVRYVWIKEVREFRGWVEEGNWGDEGGG